MLEKRNDPTANPRFVSHPANSGLDTYTLDWIASSIFLHCDEYAIHTKQPIADYLEYNQRIKQLPLMEIQDNFWWWKCQLEKDHKNCCLFAQENRYKTSISVGTVPDFIDPTAFKICCVVVSVMFSTGTMTYCVFWSFTLVLLLTQLLVTHPMGTTPIEDHLETEIDNRAPNSFKEQSFQYLSVRQIGFKDMCYNNSGAISCSSIGNWEVWSFRYGSALLLLCP